ncbi:MAG: AAA family ATPase [Chloroflexi bacterium]|nr:AAA family ATPase [Chloroflexota bacterium]
MSAAATAALLAAARRYRERGLSVVAVSGKRPTDRWARYIDELPGPLELEALFSASERHEPTGLAVVLGAATWANHPGLFVVEIEARHRAEAELWLDEHLPNWRAGLVAQSGGGSLHLYLAAPAEVATRTFKWGEVRGRGSVTVLPPSLHPNGRPYHWLSKGEPLRVEPDALALPGAEAGRRAYGALGEGPVGEGRRNGTLTSLGGALRRSGLDAAIIEATLQHLNAQRCEPALPEDEVASIAASVSRYEPGAPWQPTPAGAERGGLSPVVVKLADVQPEQVRWLWPGKIPLGKVTVLDGDPGLGKSLVTLDLAARTSTGCPMPDSTRGLGAPAGVVLLSAEDDLSDTIRPRLDAAGADCSRIVALTAVRVDDKERFATLADIAAIREAIVRVGAKLVIIDPLMAYIATDAHVDADVRSRLAPLTKLAAELGVAVVVIRHLNKAGGGNALYRGGGSIGIIAAARSGLLVARDPEDATGERRILACTKSNLAKMPPALAYRIVANADGAVRVEWIEETAHTASQLLAAPTGDDERGAMDEAKDWLRSELMTGARPSKVLQREARGAGIADITLRRAREALGIRPQRVGYGSAGEWMWALPTTAEQASSKPKMLNMPIDAHPKSMSIYGDDEHLSSPARSLGLEEGEL